MRFVLAFGDGWSLYTCGGGEPFLRTPEGNHLYLDGVHTDDVSPYIEVLESWLSSWRATHPRKLDAKVERFILELHAAATKALDQLRKRRTA